ncbi:MAG: hypothetical protein ACE5FD_08350 [Anaerolineae bacterium]
MAKPVPYTQDTSLRKLGAGQWKGKIWMADDVLKLFAEDADNNESPA